MQLLDWLVVATVGAIVLVLGDGVRRKLRDRRNRVVMKLERNIPQEDIDLNELPNSELPNGGARTLVRDTDPPVLSVVQRKRNYGLKDGRDKVRSEPQSAPESASVPVLMDQVEIEETDIEHANVFVTADNAPEDFADDELPPDVVDGLDNEFHDDAQGKPANHKAEDAEDEEADDYVHAEADPLMDGVNEFEESFEEASDEDEEDAEPESELHDIDEEGLDHEHDDAEEPAATVASPVATDAMHDEELADDDEQDDEAGEEGEDEEYDPYQDENFYENEPALLENAYRLATSRFQRQPKEEPAPRIEPGFGEQGGEPEEESNETFGAVIDETAMDQFLEDEQEEIRAWRNQSVTQQEAPPPVVPNVTAQAAQPELPKPKPAPQPAPAPVIEPPATYRVAEPEPPMQWTPEPSSPMAAAPAPAAAPKEAKQGFWQAMAGKAAGKNAKPAKVEPPKINQGELFQEESAEEEPVAEHGPQEVIIINVMAKPGSCFYGDELLPVLQHYGLRLGNMNIFHRHTELDGSGPIMFSMANMVKPGTFALGNMEQFMTPGISFFMQMPNRHGNMKAFEQMLATANAVKQSLDGQLKDERRSVLTRQTVEHCRQRVRDFELSLLTQK